MNFHHLFISPPKIIELPGKARYNGYNFSLHGVNVSHKVLLNMVRHNSVPNFHSIYISGRTKNSKTNSKMFVNYS